MVLGRTSLRAEHRRTDHIQCPALVPAYTCADEAFLHFSGCGVLRYVCHDLPDAHTEGRYDTATAVPVEVLSAAVVATIATTAVTLQALKQAVDLVC